MRLILPFPSVARGNIGRVLGSMRALNATARTTGGLSRPERYAKVAAYGVGLLPKARRELRGCPDRAG